MDIPITFLRGVRLGLREAYHGFRVLHWADHDRRHPGGAGWVPEADNAGNLTGRMTGTGRNAPGGARDRVINEWGKSGERWTRLRAGGPQVPLPLADRLRAGEDFRIMDGKSLQDLREYNQYAVEDGIYKPANDLIQQIKAAGNVGMYSRIYARLTSNVLDTRVKAEKQIITLFANNWHRAKQMSWFKEKIEFQYKLVKKTEIVHLWKFLMQLQNKILHNLNDKTMKEILEKLMKILGWSSKLA